MCQLSKRFAAGEPAGGGGSSGEGANHQLRCSPAPHTLRTAGTTSLNHSESDHTILLLLFCRFILSLHIFTILWIYVKPCQAVLRLRESRSRNLSKQSADFTDDEDLGLPKSLQNSPGDFSDGLEVTSGSRVGPGWGTSRHHSSCSDNSLLSLDSFSEAAEETVSPQTRLSGLGDGRLSHQAAKHKMAVRPRRNHAVRPPRRLQQLEEREEPEPIQETRQPEIMRSFEEQRAKSKSLDMSYRSEPPSPAAMQQMSQSNQEKPKGRRSEPEGFLSRLFGSRRQKMRSSVGSVGEGDAARVVGGTRGSGEPPRLSYYQPSSNYQLPPTQQPPALSSPSPPPPTRHKTKPPAPPPPDSPPPLQGRPLFLCTTLTYNRH